MDRAHPTKPVPRRRVWCWLAGLGVLVVATQSVIGAYDTTLFTVHMTQHLLLTMVAAPLLLLGAPVTLLLRASSPEVRTGAHPASAPFPGGADAVATRSSRGPCSLW